MFSDIEGIEAVYSTGSFTRAPENERKKDDNFDQLNERLHIPF